MHVINCLYQRIRGSNNSHCSNKYSSSSWEAAEQCHQPAERQCVRCAGGLSSQNRHCSCQRNRDSNIATAVRSPRIQCARDGAAAADRVHVQQVQHAEQQAVLQAGLHQGSDQPHNTITHAAFQVWSSSRAAVATRSTSLRTTWGGSTTSRGAVHALVCGAHRSSNVEEMVAAKGGTVQRITGPELQFVPKSE